MRSDLTGVDVFISHVEEDQSVALQLADALEASGYSTWTFERDTVPGPSYLLQTSRAIEGSRAVVVLISPDSLGSHQVTSEVVRAHEEVKPFVPVLIGITREEFATRQPEWREALGSAAALDLPAGGVEAVAPRIVGGLAALGIEPQPAGAPRKAPAYAATPPVGIRGPGRGRRRWLVSGVVAVLVAVSAGVVVALVRDPGDGTGPATSGTPTTTPTGPAGTTPTSPASTAPSAPAADAATTAVQTLNGPARVQAARVVARYCSVTGDCKTAPAGRRYLLLDLTAWGSGDLAFDQALSMSAFGSYVAYEGERASPVETMVLQGSPAGFTVVYSNLPEAAAGTDVHLFWPDNPLLRVRTKG